MAEKTRLCTQCCKTEFCLGIVFILFMCGLVFAQSTSESIFNQAEELFVQGEYSRARSLYNRILDDYPNSPVAPAAAFRVADTLIDDVTIEKRRRLNEAIQTYELALANYPDSLKAPEAYYNLAISYINIGFVQDAIIQLRNARDRYPQAPNMDDLHLLLADSYFELEDYSQAVLFYQSFLETFPLSAHLVRVKTQLLKCFHTLGDFRRLFGTITDITNSRPDFLKNNPEFRFHWAEALMFTGSLDEAENQLKLLMTREDLERLFPHALVRLGDIYRIRARGALEDSDRRNHFESANSYYLQVINMQDHAELADSAALRLTETSDEADIDIVTAYKLPTVDQMLNNVYEQNLDPEFRVLVLTRLARHHRNNGRIHTSLEYYKTLVENYQEIELVNYITSENKKYLRDLLNASFISNEYSQFVDIFLGFGAGLELSTTEKLRLAISFSKVQLYDRAIALFGELRELSIGDEEKKKIALEYLEISFQRKNWVSANREIEMVLSLNPTSEERSQVLLKKQEMYFADRDLKKLQTYFLENVGDFDTPRLRSSILFKLGTLYFIDGNLEEAKAYLESFFDEFGDGESGNTNLYNLLRQATLTLADTYFQLDVTGEALLLYERFIYLFNRDGDIAWPLLQSGFCRQRLNQNELARAILREFIRLYPDHYLRSQADKALSDLGTTTGGGS